MAAVHRRCLDAGMSERVARPVTARGLIATVVRWVGEGEDATASPEAGIDAQLALQRAGGNAVLRDRMLHVFIEHHRDDPERLRTALAEEDWETLRQLGMRSRARQAPSGSLRWRLARADWNRWHGTRTTFVPLPLRSTTSNVLCRTCWQRKPRPNP